MPSPLDDLDLKSLASPLAFLEHCIGNVPIRNELGRYEAWWGREGAALSRTIDEHGTPHLKRYDERGERIDDILYPEGYRRLLNEGYRMGAVYRAFGESLRHTYMVGHVTSYYDMGLYCPHIVSLGTAVPLEKYGSDAVRDRFLHALLQRDEPDQGATWMTEIAGGSDLGNTVRTTARKADAEGDGGDRWVLNGEKYFCSNAWAEQAVVAARPEGAEPGAKGLALFLVPRRRRDGTLNVELQRLKPKIGTRSVPTGEVRFQDSEAYLLGTEEQGIYITMEVLNLSRVANAVGSTAVAQHALHLAVDFAREREVFGGVLLEKPLMARQVRDRYEALEAGMALSWYAVDLLDGVWRQEPPYDDRFHLFRLVTHLAKYHTALLAVDMCRWAMEVWGGIGTLEEYPVERLLRESLILPVWEGPGNLQVLDGLEVMRRKEAHTMLLDELGERLASEERTRIEARLDELLKLPRDEMEAEAEGVFADLADVVARALVPDRS